MDSLVAAAATENKPKLFRRVRDAILLRVIGCGLSRHTETRNQKVGGHKSDQRGQSFYCSMSILLSRKSKTKAIPSNGRSSVWIIPSRKPAKLNACDLEVVVSAWIRACGSCEVVNS